MSDPIPRFADLVARPAAQVDLARAALAFAQALDPAVDELAALAELDALAAGVDGFAALRERLFARAGFTGAGVEHHEPERSLLHRVLADRRGIPISLSIVVIEVGRRAGVAVEGVGAPGHFLVRDVASGQLCDPYHSGALLDEAGARALVARVTGRPVPEDADVLPAVDSHDVLTRMLANLVHVYERRGQWAGLETVLRCQRAIPGRAVPATMALADVLARQGGFDRAAAELDALADAARQTDAERLRVAARSFRARLS